VDTVGIAFGVIGAIGALPVVGAVGTKVLLHLGGRSVLRMEGWPSNAPLDIVMTTSGTGVSPVGPRIARPTTGFGQVNGLTYCARTVGLLYRRKEILAHISESTEAAELTSDLVLLGGLQGNEYSEQFAEQVRAKFGARALNYRDERHDERDGNYLAVEDYVESNFDLKASGVGQVEHDLGLIVFWRNVIKSGSKWHRGVLCMGFSTYGTAEAARYAFQTLVPTSSFGRFGGDSEVRKVRRAIAKKRNCVICVVRITFPNAVRNASTAIERCYAFDEKKAGGSTRIV
jgi:hypothetical protein